MTTLSLPRKDGMPEPSIDPTQPEIKVSLHVAQARIRAGEIMDVNGSVEPAVWLEGQGRRQHAANERVVVDMFMSPDDALRIAIDLIVARASILDP